jgi:hypothetical protein
VRDQLADVKRKVFGVETEEEPGPRQASA